MLDRFWAKVSVGAVDECWPYGTTQTYGRFQTGRGLIGAHRLSLILATGEEGIGLLAMHACDNPPCVNPDHLSWGTVSDNARDAMQKGRLDMGRAWAGIKQPTHCKRGHELEGNSYPATATTGRRCKTCHAVRAKKNRAKANETRRAWRARKREEMKDNGNPTNHTVEWID